MSKNAVTKQITVPSESVIAEVSAWPDEVQVSVKVADGILTIDQARELVALLLEAIEDAPHLDWNEAITAVVDDRVAVS